MKQLVRKLAQPSAAIVGVYTTPQALKIDRDPLSLCLEAARGALADAGMDKSEIDGISARWPGPGGTAMHPGSSDWATMLGIPLRWIGDSYPAGVPALMDATAAITMGHCNTVLVVGGQSRTRVPGSVIAYTRPDNEFTGAYGSYTSAQFALVAQRYFHKFKADPVKMAEIAAGIRNMGSIRPGATLFGRGPFTAETIMASPMVVEPFHLLELCLASEGAAAFIVTSLERARDCPKKPIRVLGGGMEYRRQQYVDPPIYEEVWNLGSDAFSASRYGGRMRFLWPELLWLLLLIPVLIAAYLYALHRRKKSAIRYASLMLVRDAIGPRQALRRHIPPALFLLALTTAIIAVSRPSATVILPAEYMTVVLAMDVSRSMLATDVAPNRITGAQQAAKAFIEGLPRNIRLAIVTFAGTAAVVQTVTEKREDMQAAIDRFELQRGTATGSGLIVALSVLFPDDGIDLESALFDNPYSRWGGGVDGTGGYGGSARSLDKKKAVPKKEFRPVPMGSYTGGTIVLMSDGRRTTGPDPVEVAKMAADRGVRVYTVGFGTKDGAAIPGGWGGWSFWARLDEEALKGVAKRTGGEYFHAASADDLKKVYEHLGTKFALERQETEVSALLSAGAALLVILAAVLSLLWFQRRS